MNYDFYTDGIFFGVRETSRDVDGIEVFRTFTEARCALERSLRDRAGEYLQSARDVRRMRKHQVERRQS